MYIRLALISLTFLVSATASAATFTVNTTNDTVDANLGNNICADAAGKCSLRAAVMQANAKAGSDTVKLPAGTFKLSLTGMGEDNTLTGDLDVHETLTVIGAGSTSTKIDGLTADKIFHVLPIIGTPAFKIQGVELANGNNLGGGGGAVEMVSTGKLTLVDTYMHGNKSPAGGAFLCLGALTILDSVFERNSGISVAGVGYKAGPGDVLISNSRFEDNSASSAAGALYLTGAVDSFNIIDSEFINNNSSSSAGALLLAFAGPLKIEGSSFLENSAAIGGGILDAGGTTTTVEITDSEFKDNFGVSGASAMYLSHTGKAKVVNSIFQSNKGISGQAAVSITGSTVNSDIEILNSNFLDNNSGLSIGGALYAVSSGSVKISGSEFHDNQGNAGGGAAFLTAASTVTVSNSEFLRNFSSSGPGGGIYGSGGTAFTIVGSRFGSNSGNGGGGGAYVSTNSLNVTESVFFGNNSSAGPGGGAVLAGTTASLRNVTFSGNSAQIAGGLYGGGVGTLTNLTFAENFAVGAASALDWGGATVTVKNSLFADKLGVSFCSAVLPSGGNNVFEDSSCGFALGSDQLTANAAVFALDDNGGNTFTHALGGSSPALDKFTGNGCPSIDQRGQARPFDGDDDGSARCDSGAFESHDLCPNDPAKLTPGVCGCDTPDLDSNNNGIIDCLADQDLEAQAIALRKLVSKFQATDSGKKRKNKRSAIKKALANLVDFAGANSSGINVQGASTLDTLVGKVNNKVKKALNNEAADFLTNKDKAKKAIKKLLKGVVVGVG